MSEERVFLSEGMIAVIARNMKHPERISSEAQAYGNGKYRGWLKVWDGMRFSGQPQPMISTNAVFRTADAATAHMRGLVEQIREAAITGDAKGL